MEKHFYFLKLNPPRPDFAQSLTPDEKKIMGEHSAYWKNLLQKGICLVYGPVLDPKDTYGIGIVEVESEERLKALIANDPAEKLGKYEFYQILAVKS
jgi:uncharacterized protein